MNDLPVLDRVRMISGFRTSGSDRDRCLCRNRILLLALASFLLTPVLALSAIAKSETIEQNQEHENSPYLNLRSSDLRVDQSQEGMSELTHRIVQDDNQDDGEELPPVKVVSEAESEDDLVGPYRQPEWTATHQRFATTRAYVLPPNVYEFEVFVEQEANEGSSPGYAITEELKIGLPNRFQLDFYEVQSRGPSEDSFHYDEHKIELRWALDEWGEIPWNPTFYVEWETGGNSPGDGLELKTLFAETLQPRLHFAWNVIYEQSLSESEREYGVSFGLSYTLLDQKFSVGLEGEAIREEHDGEEDEDKFQVGPAFEWSPSDRTSLRLSPLVGLGPDSTDLHTFLIFGIEFGSGVEGKRASGPKATETR